MKRKEIIDLLESAGQLMDAYEEAKIKDRETGEIIGAVTSDEIRGMQTGLAFCKHLLDGSYLTKNPARLADLMILFHGSVKFDLDPYDHDNCRDAGEADVEEG